MDAWLNALAEEKRARPSFAAMESQIETAEELRIYRAWRKVLEQEANIPQKEPGWVAEDREWLRRQIRALAQTKVPHSDGERRKPRTPSASRQGARMPFGRSKLHPSP